MFVRVRVRVRVRGLGLVGLPFLLGFGSGLGVVNQWLGATVQLASGSPTLRGHCSAPRAIQGMKLGALDAA